MKAIRAACAAVFLGAAVDVSAQDWTTVGPQHTSARALIVRAGGELLLGSGAGLLRSTDGGTTWTLLANGLPNGAVTAVASPASQPQVIYVSVEDRGIYKSTNNGAAWSAVNTGLPVDSSGAIAAARAILIDPGNTATVYAMAFNALFKTTNGGGSWTTLVSGGLSASYAGLAIDPAASQNVFLLVSGAFGSGLSKSTNGGASFSPIANFGPFVAGLAMDPVTSATIYVIDPICGSPGCVSIRKSTDGGATFPLVTASPTFPSEPVQSLAIDPQNPDILYAGTSCEGSACKVYKSTNGGSTWSSSTTHLTHASIDTLAIDLQTPAIVYAAGACPVTSGSGAVGTCGGIAKTTTGGSSWSAVPSTGVFNAHITSLVSHPVDAATVFAGTMNIGAFKSTNRGATWTAINSGLGNLNILALSVEAVSPHRVYVATSAGVFRNGGDGGGGFAALNTGLETAGPMQSIASHRTDAGVAYACGAVGHGLYKLTGVTWALIRTESCSLVVTDPVSAHTVYIASAPDYQLMRSTDDGASFPTVLGPAVPGVHSGLATVSSVAIDPTNPAILWATAHRGGGMEPGYGVFRSTDSGTSWTRLGGPQVRFGGVGSGSFVVLDPVAPSRAYVVDQVGGSYILTEAGQRWTPLTHVTHGGLVQFRGPSALAALGGGGSRVLLGTTHNGVLSLDPAAPPAGVPTCSYEHSYRGGFFFPAAGGSASLTVTAPSGCSWGRLLSFFDSEMYDPTFGTVTRSGTSTLSLTMVPNPGASLGNWMLIANRYFGIARAAAGCTYSLATNERSFPSAGGSGTLMVTAGAGCYWTAGSASSWLTPWTEGALPGFPSGTASFHYSVAANPTTSGRTAIVDVAGQPFTVTQAGTCVPGVTPTSISIPGEGGGATLTITAPAGCSWGAQFSAGWMIPTTLVSGVGNGSLTFSVGNNVQGAIRSGTINVGGTIVNVTQPVDPGCSSISIQPTGASVGSGGATGLTFSVTAGSTCNYSVSNSHSWITITSGQAFATGSRTVVYNVAPNSSSTRIGTLYVGGVAFTVTQAGSGTSQLTLDKTVLYFGAAISGSGVVAQTAAQTVHLTQSGSGAISWTATPTQPWLKVSPTSGAGSQALTISVDPSGPGASTSGTVVGAIAFSFTAANTPVPINVFLTLLPAGATPQPFGTIDTPTDHRTGVAGAIPMTGWVLDEIEVTRVMICRAASSGEVAPIDPNCGGTAQIFVGFGVFIDGARPDVAAAYPTYPLKTRAGWGFMVLTNMLPNQGNGTYQFTIWAQDREGHTIVLGTRTMTCANASSTLPFGTLDTPTQGGSASGSSYVNFGWVLTPKPKTIPIDGSTIQVLVDGVSVGNADYNHARPDIQALFPGFNNTDGAVGFRILDTTAMTNGLHTISWTVTDDQGAIEGIGSRFFAVTNGVTAVTAAAASLAQPDVETLPVEKATLNGRTGWDLAAPYRSFEFDSNGRVVIRAEEVSRIELQLGSGGYAGYLRSGNELGPLPAGTRLDPTSGSFTWAPIAGFVGRYDFVFVRAIDGRAASRRLVRVILQPRGGGAVGPQITVDVPAPRQTVRQPFMVGGWAVDLDASDGSGITTIHAWAYPAQAGPPIFLGATAYGGARPDVAAVHGDRFVASGFGLIVQGLPAAEYDLVLFPWSSETVGFVSPAVVRVRVEQ
jgi:hypothetical protein